MTVIFLARRYYPMIGGVEAHVMEISKELIKRGHKIVVITEDAKIGFDKNTRSVEGIVVIRINVGSNDWFMKFRIWEELWKLRLVIKKADIVHCHDVFFWFLPFRFIYPSKKVYTTFHGHETKFPLSKRAIIIRKISEKLSKGNICVGNYIKKWYGTKPDYVIYGGVSKRNLDEKEDVNHKSHLDIIFVGRLQNDLGIKTYLESLHLLKKKNINFKFQAYGDGELREKVEKIGKVHGFTENLEIVIKKADIVFCSSYLTMLEALVSKSIVIAVYENELKEDYLKDSPFAKYVYICINSKEVCEVVKSLVLEPWKSTTMVESGYNWAKQQSWQKITDKYLSLWKI